MSKQKEKVYQIKNEVVNKIENRPEEVLERVKIFLNKNQRVISYILSAIILLVVANWGYGYYIDSQNQEAQRQSIRAIQYFEKDSLDKTINGDGQFPGFKSIYDDYSSTPTGNLAKYYLGLSYLKKGQFQEGIEYLESFDKPSGNLISAAAYSSIAYAYEELNQLENAARNYEQAARVFENTQTTPYYLSLAAADYEAAGNKNAALAIYKEILSRYPNSQESALAERMAEKLAN